MRERQILSIMALVAALAIGLREESGRHSAGNQHPVANVFRPTAQGRERAGRVEQGPGHADRNRFEHRRAPGRLQDCDTNSGRDVRERSDHGAGAPSCPGCSSPNAGGSKAPYGDQAGAAAARGA